MYSKENQSQSDLPSVGNIGPIFTPLQRHALGALTFVLLCSYWLASPASKKTLMLLCVAGITYRSCIELYRRKKGPYQLGRYDVVHGFALMFAVTGVVSLFVMSGGSAIGPLWTLYLQPLVLVSRSSGHYRSTVTVLALVVAVLDTLSRSRLEGVTISGVLSGVAYASALIVTSAIAYRYAQSYKTEALHSIHRQKHFAEMLDKISSIFDPYSAWAYIGSAFATVAQTTHITVWLRISNTPDLWVAPVVRRDGQWEQGRAVSACGFIGKALSENVICSRQEEQMTILAVPVWSKLINNSMPALVVEVKLPLRQTSRDLSALILKLQTLADQLRPIATIPYTRFPNLQLARYSSRDSVCEDVLEILCTTLGFSIGLVAITDGVEGGRWVEHRRHVEPLTSPLRLGHKLLPLTELIQSLPTIQPKLKRPNVDDTRTIIGRDRLIDGTITFDQDWSHVIRMVVRFSLPPRKGAGPTLGLIAGAFTVRHQLNPDDLKQIEGLMAVFVQQHVVGAIDRTWGLELQRNDTARLKKDTVRQLEVEAELHSIKHLEGLMSSVTSAHHTAARGSDRLYNFCEEVRRLLRADAVILFPTLDEKPTTKSALPIYTTPFIAGADKDRIEACIFDDDMPHPLDEHTLDNRLYQYLMMASTNKSAARQGLEQDRVHLHFAEKLVGRLSIINPGIAHVDTYIALISQSAAFMLAGERVMHESALKSLQDHLHDNVTKGVTGAIRNTRWAVAALPVGYSQAQPYLTEILDHLQLTRIALRELVRPTHNGHTVEERVERFFTSAVRELKQDVGGHNITFHDPVLGHALHRMADFPHQIAEDVYVALRRLTDNVVTHAEAEDLIIFAEYQPHTEMFSFGVVDNGKGVPPDILANHMGFGLRRIVESIETRNGYLRFESLVRRDGASHFESPRGRRPWTTLARVSLPWTTRSEQTKNN